MVSIGIVFRIVVATFTEFFDVYASFCSVVSDEYFLDIRHVWDVKIDGVDGSLKNRSRFALRIAPYKVPQFVQMIITIYRVQDYQVRIINPRWPPKIQDGCQEIQFFDISAS